MRRLAFILAACLLALAASVAQGAPSVTGASGTWTSGQSVTLSGTLFGTKSPAAPVLWAPFASNINPSSLSRITSWLETECMQYTSTGGKGGGGGAKTNQTCAGQAYSALYVDTAPIFYLNTYSQKWFVYRNRYKAYSDDVNLKSMEFNHTSYGTADLIFNDSSTQLITQGLTPDAYYYAPSAPVNQWISETLRVQSNATNSAAVLVGEWCQNATCSNIGDHVDWYDNFFTLRDDNNLISRVGIAYHGDYNCGGSCPQLELEYFDNLYLDNTWSRVILGNASTFSGSTQREIQAPTAWSDNSATISVNTGSFTTGQTAYVYVCDSNNSCNSSGFSITIDSGTSSNPPVMQSISCSPTLNQAPAATTCTASATNSPTSYTWTGNGTNCTFGTPTAASTTLTCSYGGARTPCATATNADGTSAQMCVTTNSIVWRYVKPTGFGAN